MKLLIITNKEDVTVDIVVDNLNQRRLDYYRFNTEDIGKTVFLTLNLSEHRFTLLDTKKQRTFNLDDFGAVYYRRPELPGIPENLDHDESVFWSNEIYFLLEGIYQILANKRWLNYVYDIRLAESKLQQILIAQDIGFNVPKSLITNMPTDAIDFISKNEASIFKPIKCGLISDSDDTSRVLFTTRIDDKYIQNIQTIKALPTYYQNEIIKKSDIRVTIVDAHIFAAEIDSQNSTNTIVDWRIADTILPHTKIVLPEKIQRQCLQICKHFHLNFAAIDLIKDNTGKFWFLELNPNGQWGWIEQILGYPISDTIINYLFKE